MNKVEDKEIVRLFDKNEGEKYTRSHFKTSPQAQCLRWIEVANPRNRPTITVVVPLGPPRA